MEKFLVEEVKNFEILEEDVAELNAEKHNRRVRCWVGTWNNPKMSDEEFKQYFEKLYDEEVVQYVIFQREKGEETGTEHFQFFVNFKNPQYFKKVKESFIPYGCHFKPMISTAHRCREYCSKVETRLSGPYEIGEFEEERQRSDLSKAIKMIDEGVPFETVEKIFPTQCLMYSRSLKERASNRFKEDYSQRCRDVEVTYIYGRGGVGKTSKVFRENGFSDIFVVSNYEKYLFENYDFKKIVVFDEFDGQIKITEMNRFLDIYPIALRGLGKTYQACYNKVYIVSNSAPSELYKDIQLEKRKLFAPFLRRLHNIIYIDDEGNEHLEKQTIFRNLREDEQTFPGLTRTIDKTIYYDRCGKILKVKDSMKFVQSELSEISEDEIGSLPW